MGLRFEDGLIAEINLDSPANGEKYSASRRETPELLNRIPQNAAVAIAGSGNLPEIARLLLSLMPEADRAEWPKVRELMRGLLLGRYPLNDVLPALGPNWVACLVPRKLGEGNGNFPADVLVAVDIPADKKSARCRRKNVAPPSTRQCV